MEYPKKLLSPAEEIITEFRPHWSRVLREGLLGVLLLVLIVLLGFEPGWLVLVLTVGFLVLVTRGLTSWWTSLHVITTERVIYRAGLISKHGKEIPLEVINDVAFKQSIFERMFGTGDLMIESAGTHGQSAYTDIPNPEHVQKQIYEAREARMTQMRSGSAPAAPAANTASQLETLSRLHDEGKLTNEEFEAEKRKLIGGA